MPTEGNEEAVVELTQEELAAQEKENEAAFAKGVAKIRGGEEPAATEGKAPVKDAAPADATQDAKADDKKDDTTPAAAGKTDDGKPADDKSAKPADATPAEDPWKDVPAVVRTTLEALEATVKAIPGQLSTLGGHIGGLKTKLEQVSATGKSAAKDSGADVPTKLEIEEALLDPEKWTQLQEDFNEWMSPIANELTRLRKDVAAVLKSIPAAALPDAKAGNEDATQIDIEALLTSAEERAFLRLKHPDWKKVCADPKFGKEWLPRQSDEIQAKSKSDAADDAVDVFDAYKAHVTKVAADAAAKAKQEQRLKGALTVTGSPEAPSTGISDEEAFNRGVKRVRGLNNK